VVGWVCYVMEGVEGTRMWEVRACVGIVPRMGFDW
jgi:hypothetical protein